MTDLTETNITPETKLRVSFEDGKLVLNIDYDGSAVDGTLKLAIDPVVLMAEIGKALKKSA